jgi:hypothetical protein
VFAAWFNQVLGCQPARLKRSDHVTELEEALESVSQGRGVTISPADAWLSGPWHKRCRAVGQPGSRVTNPLFLLSLPGSGSPARAFLQELFR